MSMIYKMLTRFGAVSGAAALSFAVCYPLDTIKRRMQCEGSPGYNYTQTNNEVKFAKQMMKNEGVKSFYKGMSTGLVRVIPMGVLQFIVFDNLRSVIHDM